MEQRIEQTSGKENGGGLDVLGLYLSRARGHKLLSRQEEAELSRRIEEGDEAAWEELVRCNLKLVISIARRYAGQGLELADLIQEGNLGLMRAARSFDSEFGTKFSTYATWWIKQSIGRAVLNKASFIRVPVHAAEEERSVNGARNHLRSATGREPTLEELSGFVGKSEDQVTSVLSARKAVVSYDVPVGDGQDGSLSDLLPDEPETETEELFMDGALKEYVGDLLDGLSARERYVIERRYGLDGDRCATLSEIGDQIGVTRERARQVQNAAMRKLRSAALNANLESFLMPSLSLA